MDRVILFLLSYLLIACNAHTIVMDTSMNAVIAGDYTLLTASCSPMVSQGADICRVNEGTEISQVWTLLLPKGQGVLGGQITVTYKGAETGITIPVGGGAVEIPLKSILDHDGPYMYDDRGSIVALADVQYKDNQGAISHVQMRGLLILAVLDKGYQPLPIDGGGSVAFKQHCDLLTTTSGRTSVKCK